MIFHFPESLDKLQDFPKYWITKFQPFPGFQGPAWTLFTKYALYFKLTLSNQNLKKPSTLDNRKRGDCALLIPLISWHYTMSYLS